jgi:hypothetical protein
VVGTPSDVIIVLSRFHLDRWQGFSAYRHSRRRAAGLMHGIRQEAPWSVVVVGVKKVEKGCRNGTKVAP